MPDVAPSTVYRTLEVLERLGQVEHVHLGHGPSKYHLAERVHVHLMCRGCDRVIELPDTYLDDLATRLGRGARLRPRTPSLRPARAVQGLRRLMDTNQGVVLRRRPEGLVTHDDFELVELPMPEPGPGELVMQTEWLGIDATVRTWLNRGEGYLPPVEIGEVVRCSGIGRVVASTRRTLPRRHARLRAPGLAALRARARRRGHHHAAPRRQRTRRR